jgi:hypothetical protein
MTHVSLTRRQDHVLLLLPDADVWVKGLSEILFTHPAKRVGFVFIRFY